MNEVEMMDEWSMWQRVCGLLDERGVKVNADDQLCRTITLWGELLVALRVKQSDEIRAHALEEATSAFNAAISA